MRARKEFLKMQLDGCPKCGSTNTFSRLNDVKFDGDQAVENCSKCGHSEGKFFTKDLKKRKGPRGIRQGGSTSWKNPRRKKYVRRNRSKRKTTYAPYRSIGGKMYRVTGKRLTLLVGRKRRPKHLRRKM